MVCRLVCRSACESVTVVSPAKTAEPIEMSFVMWTWVDPRNCVLDGDPDPPWERAIFRGMGQPSVGNTVHVWQ